MSGNVPGHRLAEQFRTDPQQAADQRGDLRPRHAERRGDLVRGRAVDEGADLHQVDPAADDRHLVARQVVVHVGDVDEERLAGQEPDASRQPGCLEHQAADVVAVMRDGFPRPVEHVRGVVAHQIVQPPVVVPAVPPVELGELIQPGARLGAVADAEFEDVELFGERPAVGQLVPDLEQVEDQVARRGGVPRVALAAGQRVLVLLARGLLPVRQGLPVQRVEPPHATRRAGHPGLQPDPVPGVAAEAADAGRRGRRVRQRLGHLGRHVRPRPRAAAQVDGQFVAVDGRLPRRRGGRRDLGGRQHGPHHGGVPEVVLVLDPVADHPHPGQVRVGPAQRLDQRAERRLRGRRPAKLAVGAYVNFHRAGT